MSEEVQEINTLLVGSDHAGFELKAYLVALLRAGTYQGPKCEVQEFGAQNASTSLDYPDVAHEIAERISNSSNALGILVCGSGIGMAIAANRHPHIRAVVCSEPYSAAMSRAHNDANILCLGGRVIGTGIAEHIVRAFLQTSFEGGRHLQRVNKIER